MSTPLPRKNRLSEMLLGSENWALTLFSGEQMLVLGVLAIVMPLTVPTAVDEVLGWLFVVVGVIQLLIAAMPNKHRRILTLSTGFLFLLVGVLLVLHPWKGTLMLAVLLSAFFLTEGILKAIYAFCLPKETPRDWFFLSGLFSLVLAFAIWTMSPLKTLWVLGLFVGADFLSGGIVLVMIASSLRHSSGGPEDQRGRMPSE